MSGGTAVAEDLRRGYAWLLLVGRSLVRRGGLMGVRAYGRAPAKGTRGARGAGGAVGSGPAKGTRGADGAERSGAGLGARGREADVPARVYFLVPRTTHLSGTEAGTLPHRYSPNLEFAPCATCRAAAEVITVASVI